MKLKFDANKGIVRDPDEIYFSYFSGIADSKPCKITMQEFINILNTKNPTIDKIRKTFDKAGVSNLKRTLPCVTISGVFQNGHKEANLVEHSGLICMDFDALDNPKIVGNVDEWRNKIGQDQYVRLSFISVSGTGFAVVVEIHPSAHLDSFNELSAYFYSQYGLVADKACKDVSRLRFVSYDPDLVINNNYQRYVDNSLTSMSDAELFNVVKQGASIEASTSTNESTPVFSPNIVVEAIPLSKERTEEIASALEFLSPNNRQDWLEIGMALKNETTHQSAYELWKKWSKEKDTAGKYNEADLDRVWQSISPSGGITIRTLFARAIHNGWVQPIGIAGECSVVESMDDLMVAPLAEKRYLIYSIVEEGDYCELIAPSKSRKSFFAIQLGVCLSSGVPFLDWLPTGEHRVLYVNLEIKKDSFVRRVREMYQALGVKRNPNLFALNLRRTKSADPLGYIANTVHQLKPKFTIIDPLYLVHNEAENDQQAMTKLVKRLMNLIEEEQTTLLVVHHDAKGAAGDRNNRDRGSGSGVLMRASDVRIVITPHAESMNEDLFVIEVMGRDIPPREQSARFANGIFNDEECMQPIKETSSTTKTTTDKRAIEMMIDQAANYIIDKIINAEKPMQTKDIRKILKDEMQFSARWEQAKIMKNVRDFIDVNGVQYNIGYLKYYRGTGLYIYGNINQLKELKNEKQYNRNNKES